MADRRSTTGTPLWVKVFGTIALVLVLLLVVVQFIGGGRHDSGRHTSSGGHGRHTAPSSGHENSGAGGPAAADEAARTIAVTTLDTMTFAPSRITVSAGETVTFVVTNTGQAVDEFTLGDAAMQQGHADEMTQMRGGMAHDGPTSIRLQPGETGQLIWRFGDTGTFAYGRHEPGHYQAGMRGQITQC